MIIIRADRANAKTVSTQLLTSGMVGAQVKFVFSNEWEGLRKTAVFQVDDKAIDVLDSQWDGNICTIPNECLATSGKTITVGVYGCNDVGDLVIPTVYTKVGRVRLGADPSNDENAKSSLPVYEQIRSEIGKLSDLDTVDKSNLVAAINEVAKTEIEIDNKTIIKDEEGKLRTAIGGYNTSTTITWDGDTEGLVTVYDMAYKVSNLTFTEDQLKTATYSIFYDGKQYSYTGDSLGELRISDDKDAFWIINKDFDFTFVFVIIRDNFSLQGMTFPEKGIYFMLTQGIYTSSLTIPSIEKIDSKFIPIETSISDASTDAQIPSAKAVNTAIKNNKVVFEPATAEKLGGIKVGENLSITEDGTISADVLQADFYDLNETSPAYIKNSPFTINNSHGEFVSINDVVAETPILLEREADSTLSYRTMSPEYIFRKSGHIANTYDKQMRIQIRAHYISGGKEHTSMYSLVEETVVKIDEKNWYAQRKYGEKQDRFYVIYDLTTLSEENKSLFPEKGAYLWMTQASIDSNKQYDYSYQFERIYYNRRLMDDFADPVFCRNYALADGTYTVGVKDSEGSVHEIKVEPDGTLHTGTPPKIVSDAVSYGVQELTEDQQIQARKNLGLYYKKTLFDISWDGDTTGKESILDAFYKVAPAVGNIDENLLGIIEFISDGQHIKTEIEIDDYSSDFGADTGTVYGAGSILCFLVQKEFTVQNSSEYEELNGVTFSPGVYLINTGSAYITRFYQVDEQRIPLDNINSTFSAGTGKAAEAFNGISPDSALGENSHVEGLETLASGMASHAEGRQTHAKESFSHAEGLGNLASGAASHAQGQGTVAFGYGSFAGGFDNEANGYGSTALGDNNIVYGSYETVIGQFATIQKEFSESEEYDSTKTYQTGDIIRKIRDTDKADSTYDYYVCIHDNVTDFNVGNWTRIDNSPIRRFSKIKSYPFRVGVGQSINTRADGFTLDWSGNGWFAGDVYVGSTSGINRDDGSKKLATEEYVDSQKFSGSYNDLTDKPEIPDTTPFIIDYENPKTDDYTNAIAAFNSGKNVLVKKGNEQFPMTGYDDTHCYFCGSDSAYLPGGYVNAVYAHIGPNGENYYWYPYKHAIEAAGLYSEDAGNYYTSTNVMGQLQEVGEKLANTTQSIPKIESLDTSNIKTFRSIEDGIYILDGYFAPYTGSDSTFIFDPPALVSISSTDSETHVQIFEAYNNQVQHLVITDTSCEETYVPLNDIAKSAANSLPSVTASDNGKILQVVDGAWAAATIPNANGVSF